MSILKLVGAFLIVVATPAFAKDGAWVVTQKSGDVRVLKSGLQPASLQVRASLSPGDVVATGANGRAMLTKGDDYVVVAPGSRLVLPKEEQAKGFTRLIQQVGTMLYKVKHTGVPHFAVDTPMLAAVVKGTSFTVIVDDKRAAVQVTDGIVEVSSPDGTARRLVERGMTVYVGRERPGTIVEMKPGTRDVPVAATAEEDSVKIAGSGDVPVSAITELTGGLVREAPTTAPVLATKDVETKVAPAPIANDSKPVEVVKASAPIVTEVIVDSVETTAPIVKVVEPVVKPLQPVVTPIIEPVVVPIVETVVIAPVVTPIVTPIVETIVVPVVAPIVTPIVAPIVTPVVAPIVTPVITPVVTPIVETVTPVVVPIVKTIPKITQPIITNLPGLGSL